MKQTRLIMGMPITVEIVDDSTKESDIEEVFSYFIVIDEMFSTYKKMSQISLLNAQKLSIADAAPQVKEILQLAEDTKKDTNGFFDIKHEGILDPSGIVKGWAIYHASELLKKKGYKNYSVDAGGDIQVNGRKSGNGWRVGIRNPFNREENVKVVCLSDEGIATSGTAIRGQHIYNPHNNQPITDIVSFTIIAPNIYDADRFATAAFAMGKDGIDFISKLDGFAGYVIDVKGIATFTKNFERYVV